MGLDQHREQITYDVLDTETGEVRRGRIRPADRRGVRRFLAGFAGQRVEAAVEATMGWRFVVEELVAAGAVAHLAEPAETRARRGPKRRAKTDRHDARHLRELLQHRLLPESWIAPEHILELRSKVRLRRALIAERTEWQQHPGAVVSSRRAGPPAAAARGESARVAGGARAARCGTAADPRRVGGDRRAQRAAGRCGA
jgi:hypothetical protein